MIVELLKSGQKIKDISISQSMSRKGDLKQSSMNV